MASWWGNVIKSPFRQQVLISLYSETIFGTWVVLSLLLNALSTFMTGGCHQVCVSPKDGRLSNWCSSVLELQLRRPGKNQYRVDNLLKRKAEEGVKIFVIVYKEVSNRTTPTDSKWVRHQRRPLEPELMCRSVIPNNDWWASIRISWSSDLLGITRLERSFGLTWVLDEYADMYWETQLQWWPARETLRDWRSYRIHGRFGYVFWQVS